MRPGYMDSKCKLYSHRAEMMMIGIFGMDVPGHFTMLHALIR